MANYIVRPSAFSSGTSYVATNASSNADMTTKLSDNSDATSVIKNALSPSTMRFTTTTPSVPSDEYVARISASIRWKDGGGDSAPPIKIAALCYRAADAGTIVGAFSTDGRTSATTTEIGPALAKWTAAELSTLRLAWYDDRYTSFQPTVTAYDIWGTLYTIKRASVTIASQSGIASYPTLATTTTATIDWEAGSLDALSLRKVRTEVRVESGGSGAGTGTLIASGYTDTQFISTGSQTINVTMTDPVPNGTYNIYARTTRYREDGTTATETISSWTAASTLTQSVTAPVIPAITATTWDAATQSVEIQVSANMIPNPDFDTNTTGWLAGANSTIARVTTPTFAGAGALSITSTTSGSINANTSTGTAGIIVVPGEQYTASAYYRAATTGRNGKIDVQWYNAAGTSVATTSGTSQAFVAGAWTRLQDTHTAPATAVYARPIFSVVGTTAGSEIHYIDSAQFELGPTATTYKAAGTFSGGAQTWDLERSSDGEITWTAVRGATNGNTIAAAARPTGWIVYDYEADRTTANVYRARSVAVASGSAVTNGWSATSSVTPTLTTWNLKVPENPALNDIDINVIGEPSEQLTEDLGVFRPINRRYPVIVAGSLSGYDGSIEIMITTQAEWLTLKPVIEAQKVLLLESLFGWAKYIRIIDDVRIQMMGTATQPRRRITFNYVETEAP